MTSTTVVQAAEHPSSDETNPAQQEKKKTPSPTMSEKRSRTESPSEIGVFSPKRPKTLAPPPTATTANDGKLTIQRSELVSALALASLALNSPQKTPPQSREESQDNSDERPISNDEERLAAVTPKTPPPIKRKKVHFSPGVSGTPQREARQPSSPALSRRMYPRPMMLPQRHPAFQGRLPLRPTHPAWIHRQHQIMLQQQQQQRYHEQQAAWFSPPHLRMPPPPPRVVKPLLTSPMSPMMITPPPQSPIRRRGNPLPIPSLRQPALTADRKAENTWICDYCNSAAFATYEDACAHEEVCKVRMANKRAKTGGARQSSLSSSSSSSSSPSSLQCRPVVGKENGAGESSESSQEQQRLAWSKGVVSLAVESTDKEWLSELNCFVRQHCVEAFSAEFDDVAKTSKRGRIAIDQVGIRCKFCFANNNNKDDNDSNNNNNNNVNHNMNNTITSKGVAAVSYPTSLAGIYESVKRWQRVHLPACSSVPTEIREKLTALQSDTVWVPTTRQYWTDSAKVLGMVDTPEGIRFEREPGMLSTTARPSLPPPHTVEKEPTSKASSGDTKDAKADKNNKDQQQEQERQQQQQQQQQQDKALVDGSYVCFPSDCDMVPPYVYFLMRQVELCHFTEADRFVARSKGPVGFAGFQCRHCKGHAGLGKYFPLTCKALSTNSTSQNIHAHVLKCRKCPPELKEELVFLKGEKLRSPRLVPGWRKTFFELVWKRLHPNLGPNGNRLLR